MDVRPVDHRTHEGELVRQQGDVAEAAHLGGLAGRLQTHPHAEMGDLRADPVEVLTNARHQVVRRLVAHGPEVSHDHPGIQLGAELDRVLDGGPALFGVLLVPDRQDREVGGVGGEPDAPLVRLGGEFGAAPLLPGELLDECQLERVVSTLEEPVEKLFVGHPVGWQPRVAVPDHPARLGGIIERPAP